jgi:hypothetical protein
MEETMNTLEELIRALPPDLEQEASDLARFLSEKHARQYGRDQGDAVALRDYRQQYTSPRLEQGALETTSEHLDTLPELVQSLPPEMQQEVWDFVEFLLQKQPRKPQGQLKLDWRGALRDLRDQYTSIELQHQIGEWWEEG